MQQVLILNAGSSSLKWLVLETDSETVRQEGAASWTGHQQGRHEREIAAALEQVTAGGGNRRTGVRRGRRLYERGRGGHHGRQRNDRQNAARAAPHPWALRGLSAA